LNAPSTNPVTKLINSIAKIEAYELKATFASFSLAMILMGAYYILRPVRDALTSDWSDAELSILWTINFFLSFALVAIYGFVASRVSMKNLVPGVYSFFIVTFLLFYFFSSAFDNSIMVDKAFYLWVSVYSLFPISIFWSFMSDIYTREQSKRLFGIITTGASVGALAGPFVPLLFADLGTYNLMIVASLVLLPTIPIALYLRGLDFVKNNGTSNNKRVELNHSLGGNWFSGFKLFLKNPFLLSIGLFLFLYTGIGSFIYFELKNLMTDISREERTQIWSIIDLATNTLTIITGLFITSRIATRFGIGVTLALLPVVVVIGLVSVAIAPALAVVVGLQIFRRSGNYAITRPAREMLFTYVDQETRFKAKQVIDVIVYRGGDVFWGWAFTLLTTVVGLGMAGVALVGAGIAAIWAATGLHLGKQVELKDKNIATNTTGELNDQPS